MHIDRSAQKLPTAPGAHTCLLFDGLEDYKSQADKYILNGLKNNKKCICALEEYPISELKTRLKAWGMDVPALEKSGQLTLKKSRDSYCPGQKFDPEKTMRFIQKEALEAKKLGFDGLQGLGEPTFALGDSRAGEKLLEYENLINSELIPKYDFTALCVYNKNRHAPETIKETVKLHPQLLHNSRFYPENIYYLPPQGFAGQDRNEQEIKCWLQTLEKNNLFIRDMHENRIQMRWNLHEMRLVKKELKAIVECSRYLLEATDYGEAVRRIFDSCLEVLGCRAGYMAVGTESPHSLQVIIAREQKSGLFLPLSQSIPLRGLISESLATGTPAWGNRLTPEAHDHPIFETTQDIKNIMYIPLRRNNTKLGIIAAANRAGDFGRTETRLAESFATIASLALASQGDKVEKHTNRPG